MSGGVDSSVTALLLKRQGYEVVGLFAKCWDDSSRNSCLTYEQDYQDVAYTAACLDIPFYTVDLTGEYRREVFEDLLEGYGRGQAPNPDILCNQKIKFHHLYHHAEKLGMDYFATGHYATIAQGRLGMGVDDRKDQSYFLYAIEPAVLKKVLFPLGEIQKNQVRKIAAEAYLPTATKKDSMGICFVGNLKFSEFLAEYLPEKPGAFVDLSGQVVGEHRGAHLYTFGQRRHLGLGGAGERWYVVKKDMAKNWVYVTRGDHPQMFAGSVMLRSTRWLQQPAGSSLRCQGRIRHGALPLDCVVDHITTDGLARVVFQDPIKALSCGQSVVFYQGRECLGGGIIQEVVM